MDSPVTASAAVLVPRQVAGGPARNTRNAVRRARVPSDVQVVPDAHAVATPVVNDNIDEGVNPSWNGIDLDECVHPNDDWIKVSRREQRTRHLAAKTRRAKYLARDANNLFEPRMFTSLAEERSRIRELHASLEPTSPNSPTSPTSPTSSFNSVPETFDSNENTPQNSHSELTPEVAMYCGALQFE